MFDHERAILDRQSSSFAPNSNSKDSVASRLTDDQTGAGSVRDLLSSFLPSSALLKESSPSKEEIRLKTIEAKNEQIKLKMALAGIELAKVIASGKQKKSCKRDRSPSPSSSSSSSDASDLGTPNDDLRAGPSSSSQPPLG